MRLAHTAARDGVYTAQAARLLLILGWWLLPGGLVATVTEAFARMNLLGQARRHPGVSADFHAASSTLG